MENTNSPFDGIFSLLLLLRRNTNGPESCSRPQTSYSPSAPSASHNRSRSLTPPPLEITVPTCRPGHPADSFQRSVSTDRTLRRRSKWSWTGRSSPDDGADLPSPTVPGVSPVVVAGSKRKRISVARMMTWSSSSNLPQYAMERENYMSERAHARHTMAIERKLPRVHEAHLEEDLHEDDEEQHNAVVEQHGIVDDDEIRTIKRERALAALEKDLPLRRNEAYDNIVEMRVGMSSMHRGAWGETWSPL